jgi:pimeloyl-ACP methyl ester carboxylesterase
LFKRPQSEEYLKRVTHALAIWLGYFVSDFRPAWARTDKPTLIVAAAEDACGSVCEYMRKRIQSSRLEVMENVGHALMNTTKDTGEDSFSLR